MLQKVRRHGVQDGPLLRQDVLTAPPGLVHHPANLLVDLSRHGLGIAPALTHGPADKHLVVPSLKADRADGFAHAVHRHHLPGDIRGPLDVAARPGGDVPQAQLFRHPAPQQGYNPVLQIALGEEAPVLLRQGDGHASRLAPGDDGNLIYRVVLRQGLHDHGVARLVPGGELPLMG